MKLKIDENLPTDCAEVFRSAGFEADTVIDERLAGVNDAVIAERARIEGRVLVTLDLDFGNVRAYPPAQHAGIIVLRLKSQDKRTVLDMIGRIASELSQRTPVGELWIVESDRIRFRAG